METSSAGVFFLRSFKCINVVPGKECCENCRSTLFWGKNSHARTAGKAASVTPRPIFSQRDLKEAVPSERLHYGENDDKRGQYARRSEESREGKECVSTCRYRWSPVH